MYVGLIRDGREVAVKRVSREYYKCIINEVDILVKMSHHANIVKYMVNTLFTSCSIKWDGCKHVMSTVIHRQQEISVLCPSDICAVCMFMCVLACVVCVPMQSKFIFNHIFLNTYSTPFSMTYTT